jgi:hypothetical protein
MSQTLQQKEKKKEKKKKSTALLPFSSQTTELLADWSNSLPLPPTSPNSAAVHFQEELSCLVTTRTSEPKRGSRSGAAPPRRGKS